MLRLNCAHYLIADHRNISKKLRLY
jgi:hypothetical protein